MDLLKVAIFKVLTKMVTIGRLHLAQTIMPIIYDSILIIVMIIALTHHIAMSVTVVTPSARSGWENRCDGY